MRTILYIVFLMWLTSCMTQPETKTIQLNSWRSGHLSINLNAVELTASDALLVEKLIKAHKLHPYNSDYKDIKYSKVLSDTASKKRYFIFDIDYMDDVYVVFEIDSKDSVINNFVVSEFQ